MELILAVGVLIVSGLLVGLLTRNGFVRAGAALLPFALPLLPLGFWMLTLSSPVDPRYSSALISGVVNLLTFGVAAFSAVVLFVGGVMFSAAFGVAQAVRPLAGSRPVRGPRAADGALSLPSDEPADA